jgi:K+-sensing histidine kinase KdpD
MAEVRVRVLIVDDSEADATLLLRELRKAGYSPISKRVDTAEDMDRALVEQEWDVILCDYVMPLFSGPSALELLHKKGIDIPLIVVSGQIGEDTAVEAMRAGASDYIMKGNLKRLKPAVEREINEAHIRHQRKKVEEDLKAKEEELYIAKEIDAIKDEFIGMVSHELKTPLTIIIGALNVALSKGVSQAQSRELMKDAADNAEDLSTMVDNLLELTRYQSNRLNIEAKQTDVEPVVRAVVKNLQSKSTIHHLSYDVPSGLPRVFIDSIRIERVIYNLVDNAIKYSPNGGNVHIFCHQKDTRIVIGVRDNGIGIQPEDQTKLFQRFQRLDVKKRYDISGVGLGLRVCQILVESHSGHIWVESTPGKGSTFYIALPVAGNTFQPSESK